MPLLSEAVAVSVTDVDDEILDGGVRETATVGGVVSVCGFTGVTTASFNNFKF